jgi:hypothetical protein
MPTVRAVVTPVVTSEPILPPGGISPPTPVPTPEEDSPLLRLWRALLELVGR